MSLVARSDMDWKGRRILVTGATGFLGSHLVRRLVGLGAQVYAWAGSQDHLWRLADVQNRLTLSSVDICDPVHVRTACNEIRPDIVYHLAAYGLHSRQRDLLQAIDINIRGTAHLLRGLTPVGCQTIILTGTWAEYGSKDGPIRETDSLTPVTVYGATKAAATLLAFAFAAEERIPLTVLRPFSVYGPGEDEDKFVPYIIRSCLRGESPRLSPCWQIRDYIYVDDVIDAYLKTVDLRLSIPLVLNIASGVPIRLRELASSVVTHFRNVSPLFGAIPARDGEIRTVQADITQARSLLGWSPTRSLEEGIHLTVKWYKDHVNQFA